MSRLLELNELTHEGGIYFLPSEQPFAYSDGEQVEANLKRILDDATDLSSTSPELEDQIRDWPSEYHLSGKRANLLREYNWDGVRRVLELGCGCGAVTRYLGEQGMAVDAIEGSAERIRLAANRCRDLDGINFVCGNFNDLELPDDEYDAVLLIGVAEYAQRFMPEAGSGAEAVTSLLARVRRCLKKDGFVFIAIENRAGLKYLLGAHEDHYAKRFAGILDYPHDHGIRTYTKARWSQLLGDAGFHGVEYSYPFPDYKVPRVILSDHAVKHDANCFNHLEGMESRDYILPLPEDFGITEHLFWQALSENHSIDVFANSFCIIAHKPAQPSRTVTQFDFVHMPLFRRHPEYAVAVRKDTGSQIVKRRRYFPHVQPRSSPVRHVLRDEEYLQGTLLSVVWSRTAFFEPDCHAFDALLREYFEFLTREHQAGRLYIDLLPSNILVSDSGEYRVFDQEWEVEWDLTPRFVFFRALLTFALRHKVELARVTRGRGIYDIRDFVICGFDVAEEVSRPNRPLKALIEQEDMFQDLTAREGRHDRTVNALDTPLIVNDVNRPIQAHIFWASGKSAYKDDNSVMVEYIPTDERQQLYFELPANAAEFSRFRFDPSDELRLGETAYFLNIYDITVRYGKDRASSEAVWHIEGEDRLAEAASHMSGMVFCDAQIGRVFALLNNDPWMDFPFIPRRRLRTGERIFISVSLRVKRSAEYLLAHDWYLLSADHYDRRLAVLEERLKDKEAVEHELAAIKGSKFWRLAELYRGLIQRPILSRLPGLKRRIREYRTLGLRAGLARAAGWPRRRWRMYRGLPVEPVTAPTPYELWLDKFRREQAALRPRLQGDPPLISVLMPVYNAAPEILARAIGSVTAQTYPNWELCIADDCSTDNSTREYLARLNDPRIKIEFLPENGNISAATNAAARLAQGEYLAFMDNDDELEATALYDMAVAIQEQGADLLYSDEDFIRLTGHLDIPHFKPDYSPDLLLSHNYITHLLVMERVLFEKVGGFRSRYDGAQDYDLVLRAVEQARRIVHVASPLYHWRRTEQSTSRNPTVKPEASQNARAALLDCIERRGIDATVEETEQPHFFRVRRRIHSDPLVSIVVPYKDRPGLLATCLDSIREKSTYKNFEFVGVSNDSIAPSVFDLMKDYSERDARFRFVQYNVEFNFSRIVNHGVAQSNGDYVLLLNNDIEVISPEWIEAMLEHAQRDDVGAVGGKLLYPNNTIQHAGIMIGLGGYAGHVHKKFPAFSPGYFNRLNVVQNVSAVTGAMMMVKRTVYDELGGFDERMFAVAYNDVDFCLRAREHGLLNVFTPFAAAYHHESISRGYEDTHAKRMRFKKEMENLRQRHGAILEKGDPYYNVNFDQGSDNFSLRPIND